MPTNLYGPGDHYTQEHSHVIPALLRRFHEAAQNGSPTVNIWGSGEPRPEFLHVDDMAGASVHVMELEPQEYWSAAQPTMSHVNIGVGSHCTIRELAELIAEDAGFTGRIEFDPRNLMARLGSFST